MSKTTTRAYRTWTAMKYRCSSPSASNYADYGGRGITVCDRWATYEHFLVDMGQPPDGYTLDRIDNDGPYSPENCRWATRVQQSNNARRNRVLEFGGRKQTVAQWAAEIGVDTMRLIWRLRRGWSVGDTLTSPFTRLGPRKGHGRNAHSGKTACARGHEFTDANTYHWRGARHCRICRQLRSSARHKGAE